MTNSQKTIYVLVSSASADEEWEVIQWSQHSALAPYSNNKQRVSTAAGDVELRIPPFVEANGKVVGWAHRHIEQLHPRPDKLTLESMTDEALLKATLQLSLEYIASAEAGRGHNARSRYLAQQLREIQQHVAQRIQGMPVYIKEENNG